MTGNAFNNRIYGSNGGADVLDGAAGNDYLDGMGGVDAMTGGAGNDIFCVDSASDTVYEAAEAGSIDKVYASVDFVLDRAGRKWST